MTFTTKWPHWTVMSISNSQSKVVMNHMGDFSNANDEQGIKDPDNNIDNNHKRMIMIIIKDMIDTSIIPQKDFENLMI